jgi:hypothetical protein
LFLKGTINCPLPASFTLTSILAFNALISCFFALSAYLGAILTVFFDEDVGSFLPLTKFSVSRTDNLSARIFE